MNDMDKIVTEIYYRLVLRINLGDKEEGGNLTVDTYNFDPHLDKGDIVKIENWKIGVIDEGKQENESFSFTAQVFDIEKTVVRNKSYRVDIILESPDREIIKQLGDALRSKNSDKLLGT
ncbi:MAG: hypothetical protein V7K50_00055 [Nostoc sp.]|uniref:hypothetical protein n=1 Tax=Nostoc sp. TaxID=1180 RepID=UPI002FF9A7D8